MGHKMLWVLVSMVLVGAGCRAPAAPAAFAAQAVDTTPKILYVHVVAERDGAVIVANTVPPPDAIMASQGVQPSIGTTLACQAQEVGLVCDGGTVLGFVGCYAPEPQPQPPVLRASARQEF